MHVVPGMSIFRYPLVFFYYGEG